MNEVTFEIKQTIGVISENPKSGWKKKLNLVSWNGNLPKFDIREWNEDHTKMSRGLTLTRDEMVKMVQLFE